MYKDITAVNHIDIDERNKDVLSTISQKRQVPVEGRMPKVVSCPGLTGIAIGFRECAALIKTAQETGCSISLAANGQRGQANSMLELLKMHIDKGTYVIVSITGSRLEEALSRCHNIMAIA